MLKMNIFIVEVKGKTDILDVKLIAITFVSNLRGITYDYILI